MLPQVIRAAVIALAAASVDSAAAQQIRAGILNCDVSAGIGLIIGSQKQVSCMYQPELPGPPEAYVGSFTKFGLDIGATGGGVLIWGVYTSSMPGPGFLAGNYIGATADVTVAAGLGANVLVGGSNRTIALQPLSVSSQTGLNLAVGIGDLSLVPAPR
jgi:hypothetical protein